MFESFTRPVGNFYNSLPKATEIERKIKRGLIWSRDWVRQAALPSIFIGSLVKTLAGLIERISVSPDSLKKNEEFWLTFNMILMVATSAISLLHLSSTFVNMKEAYRRTKSLEKFLDKYSKEITSLKDELLSECIDIIPNNKSGTALNQTSVDGLRNTCQKIDTINNEIDVEEVVIKYRKNQNVEFNLWVRARYPHMMITDALIYGAGLMLKVIEWNQRDKTDNQVGKINFVNNPEAFYTLFGVFIGYLILSLAAGNSELNNISGRKASNIKRYAELIKSVGIIAKAEVKFSEWEQTTDVGDFNILIRYPATSLLDTLKKATQQSMDKLIDLPDSGSSGRPESLTIRSDKDKESIEETILLIGGP